MPGAGARSSNGLGTDGSPNEITRFDAAVNRAVDGARNPTFDHVFYALSAAADYSKLWHALAWVRGVATGRPEEALRMSTALGIESFVTNVVVKSAVGRIRPARPATDGPLPYGMRVPITSSFPSGHATAAFTAAVFLADDDALAPLWYGFAGMVAFSRVYVRMHYASDVLAGAAFGLLLGRVLRRVVAPR